MRANRHYSRPYAMKATVSMQTWRLNTDATHVASVTFRAYCPGAVHRPVDHTGGQRTHQRPRTLSTITRICPAAGVGSHGGGGEAAGFTVVERAGASARSLAI